jgi:hypothetical protein
LRLRAFAGHILFFSASICDICGKNSLPRMHTDFHRWFSKNVILNRSLRRWRISFIIGIFLCVFASSRDTWILFFSVPSASSEVKFFFPP